MPIPEQFEIDGNGNVITKPLTGWRGATFAGMGIVIALHYAESIEALESGDSKTVQLVMKPQQCLELAETLTRLANSVLKEPPAGKTVN